MSQAVTGYVYLFRKDDLYKIGHSRNPQQRSIQLGAAIVHAFPTGSPVAIERQLHGHYQDKRRKGEWFALDADDVAELCKIRECQTVLGLPANMQEAEPGARRGWGWSAPRPDGKPLNMWLDGELADALDSYLESTDPRISKTSAVESALRELLRRKGFWPPKLPDASSTSR